MPVQDATQYAARQPLGFEGQKVSGEAFNAITRLAETAAGIDFGRAVARGTADNQALLLTLGNAAAFIGISVRDVSLRPSSASAGEKYNQYDNMTVLTHGAIFVKVAGAVNDGDAARYDVGTGRFTAAAVAGNVVALPAGWVFDSTAADGEIAILVKRA